jgi:hypothetical protein
VTALGSPRTARSRRHLGTTSAALLGVLVALGISACGSNGESDPPARSPAASGGAATGDKAPPATEVVSDRPGCGELCQHAGPPAGEEAPGCPGNDSDNCAPCPKRGCAELLTRSVTVRDGLITVVMRCNVDHPCTGAFQVYVPYTVSGPLVASDISVPPRQSASVKVAVTPLGRHVLGTEREFHGSVFVFLNGTGMDVLGATGERGTTLRLRAPQARLRACNRDILAAETTSCQFAEKVFAAYVEHRPGAVRSPTTGRSYRMTCYGADTLYCVGGNDAFLTFPKPDG